MRLGDVLAPHLGDLNLTFEDLKDRFGSPEGVLEPFSVSGVLS